MVSVAQLVVAPGCGLGGRGFKSHRSPHNIIKGFRDLPRIPFLFLLFVVSFRNARGNYAFQ